MFQGTFLATIRNVNDVFIKCIGSPTTCIVQCAPVGKCINWFSAFDVIIRKVYYVLITAHHGCFEVCGAQLYRLYISTMYERVFIFLNSDYSSVIEVEYETTATFDICYSYVIFISFSLVRIS